MNEKVLQKALFLQENQKMYQNLYSMAYHTLPPRPNATFQPYAFHSCLLSSTLVKYRDWDQVHLAYRFVSTLLHPFHIDVDKHQLAQLHAMASNGELSRNWLTRSCALIWQSHREKVSFSLPDCEIQHLPVSGILFQCKKSNFQKKNEWISTT